MSKREFYGYLSNPPHGTREKLIVSEDRFDNDFEFFYHETCSMSTGLLEKYFIISINEETQIWMPESLAQGVAYEINRKLKL